MTGKNLQGRKRILLGHLNSNGDCLYATAIARQIKNDYPGCHLTWAIGSMCRAILDGNPYVDEIWEIPLTKIEEVADVWPQFERTAIERKRRNDFDELFLTQLAPGNTHLYDGMIRSSIFRAYPRPITVPIAPVLRLSPAEVSNVRHFVTFHNLSNKTTVVLFECSPKSGQSFITPEFALAVARSIVAKFPDASVILSSNVPIRSDDERIVDGSALSLRENAEITKYCSLLIGGSSGISWISTSDWAKPLPMIQLLKADAFWFASFVHDYEYWGLPTDLIIEMTDCPTDRVVQCVYSIMIEGFAAARSRFHQQILPRSNYYQSFLSGFLSRHEYRKATRLLRSNIQRHGLRREFLYWYFYYLIDYALPGIIKRLLRRCGAIIDDLSGKAQTDPRTKDGGPVI